MAMAELKPIRDVLAERAAADATDRAYADKFSAEIVPGLAPRWHVIVTQPNREATAAGHLIGRGFGTYLPEVTRRIISRGRLRNLTLPMFPNYLFLFVWDIEYHCRRILACTGVSRVLRNCETPLIVADKIINDVQTAEFNEMIRAGAFSVRARRKTHKKNRIEKWGLEAERDAEIVRISPKSYFDGIGTLDDDGRKGLLHRALGLVS